MPKCPIRPKVSVAFGGWLLLLLPKPMDDIPQPSSPSPELQPAAADLSSAAAGAVERTLWKGHSSHVVNFGTYVLCFLFVWLVIPLFIAIWKWIENRSRVYEVTTQRLRITRGIFSKRTDEVELYRVVDTTLVEPFFYRMFGAGNIVMNTNDPTTPTITLEAVKGASSLREELRKSVESCRDRKRVRVTEFE